MLVANHVSFLDVFVLGIPLRRPLNYVARSTLFLPGLGFLMRSVGAFPIQREGMGASGMKETLRRLRSGGIVTLFPEGTRSADGELGPLKQGIAVLVSRAGVPVVPAGIAGTFESWPRSRPIPIPCPVRIHYGRPITPEEIAGMRSEDVTALIRGRIEECLVDRTTRPGERPWMPAGQEFHPEIHCQLRETNAVGLKGASTLDYHSCDVNRRSIAHCFQDALP